MMIAAAPVITLIIGAALGVLNLWLSLRITRMRFAGKVSLGHGDLPLMEARCRAHGNFIENAPLTLLLMLLVELRSGPSPWLWAIGAALVIGRVLHPFGLERPVPNALRLGGMGLTWAAQVATIAWLLLIAYGVVR